MDGLSYTIISELAKSFARRHSSTLVRLGRSSNMRFLWTDRHWSNWLLFPFRAYLVIAPICFFVWKVGTAGHRIRGALAEAVAPVFCGYMLCSLIFMLAAVILFLTRRRELVAENVLLAGIAFIIALLIAPMTAVS